MKEVVAETDRQHRILYLLLATTMMSPKIVIVFGAGKHIGSATVQTFKAKGFKVAQVSRSVTAGEENGVLSIPCDLSQPSLVKGVFDKVRAIWGEPSVIVYNGKSKVPHLQLAASTAF